VRSAGKRECFCCGPPQRDQSTPEGEPTLIITAHQSMSFERSGESVSSCPGKPGDGNQLRKRTGRLLQRVEQNNRLVENAYTA
jgi:hypothetical protein